MHTIVSFRLKFYDSNKIHFVLITKLIENRKKVSKNNSKKLKKKKQSSQLSKTCFRFQNVSNEVLLTWFKFQAKISSRSRVCVQGE